MELVIEDMVGATGLELKCDPGVPYVYIGFAGGGPRDPLPPPPLPTHVHIALCFCSRVYLSPKKGGPEGGKGRLPPCSVSKNNYL